MHILNVLPVWERRVTFLTITHILLVESYLPITVMYSILLYGHMIEYCLNIVTLEIIWIEHFLFSMAKTRWKSFGLNIFYSVWQRLDGRECKGRHHTPINCLFLTQIYFVNKAVNSIHDIYNIVIISNVHIIQCGYWDVTAWSP